MLNMTEAFIVDVSIQVFIQSNTIEQYVTMLELLHFLLELHEEIQINAYRENKHFS